MCTFCGDNAVEMNFYHDHVNGGGTAIPGIGDAIAANGKASAIWIGLLRTIVDAHASVLDVFALVDWDVVLSNEDNCVAAIANTGDALGKVTEFDCVGLAPDFFVLGVDKKAAHFHEGAGLVLRTALRISRGNCRQEAWFAVNGQPVMSL